MNSPARSLVLGRLSLVFGLWRVCCCRALAKDKVVFSEPKLRPRVQMDQVVSVWLLLKFCAGAATLPPTRVSDLCGGGPSVSELVALGEMDHAGGDLSFLSALTRVHDLTGVHNLTRVHGGVHDAGVCRCLGFTCSGVCDLTGVHDLTGAHDLGKVHDWPDLATLVLGAHFVLVPGRWSVARCNRQGRCCSRSLFV